MPSEIAGARMVVGTGLAPVVTRREGQDTQKAANPVIYPALCEERAVTAVMLDHGLSRPPALRPRGPANVEQSQQPGSGSQCCKTGHRDDDLAQAAEIVLRAILGQPKRP